MRASKTNEYMFPTVAVTGRSIVTLDSEGSVLDIVIGIFVRPTPPSSQ